ncbi:MAG: DMT family transporter [Firmicutes bacterium]|nr:DMT family transporter [Bacillota bacterium]
MAGTSVISARFIAGRLGTFTITAVSLFIALLFLVPLAGSRIIESVRGASARDWAYLFLQALFGIFLFRMFLLFGLLHTSSAEAGILTGAAPAITAVLAGLLLKEKMGACKIIGILSTVAGIIFVQGLLMPGKCFMTEHIFGNVLVLCAAACESLFNVCSRVAVVKARPDEKTAMPPMTKTALVSFIAMSLCLIPACFERPAALLAELGLQGWLALIWYGVFVTALAFLFWYSGIKRCPASTAAAFSGMMPFTALLLSVLILGEHAAIQQWCGGILVISGMTLIGRERNKLSDQEVF